jgi:outer membrane protein OmpA-like peptidoglycan-associated protein
MNSLQPRTGDFSRLKRLLLREEQQALSGIEETIRRHNLRIGDDAALQHSVALILTDALREAEVRNHRELATVIAPVVVAAIKREIRNASDDVVEAMYPIMGRLIRAYVASAIRDFVEQTNRTIEGGLSARFIRLRIKSFVTRVPYRTLLIREAQALRVTSIYLIDRPSGTLLETWNADPAAAELRIDYHLIGGMLTAINNFAASALAEKESELRALDLGEARVFLRGSARHLLAVKTVGRGNRTVRRRIDIELHRTLEDLADSRRDAPKHRRETLASLAESVANFLARQRQPASLALSVFAGIAILAGLIFVQHYRERAAVARLGNEVRDVVETHAALQAFPLKIDVAGDRKSVRVAGLVTGAPERDLLISEAARRLDPVRLDARLVVVPPLGRLLDVSRSVEELNALIGRTRDEAAGRSAADLAAARAQIAEVESQLERKSAELQGRLAELYRITQDPLLKLSQWVATHAVFFANEVTFRDEALALATLAELRDLLEASGARLRLIGYTDPTGTAEGNDALAGLRAEKVAGELEKLGVSRDRLKVLGRPRGLLLSYDKGPFSSNRRVEFEIAYHGEPTLPAGEPLADNGKRP